MMRRRSAYTLLEVMLATMLALGLLGTLWTLFRTQADLFDKGHHRVVRAQLCRALTQRIAEDLRSAIQDPVAGLPTEPSGASAVRRFGLLGTSTELRFDVLQVTPEQGYAAPVGRTANVMQEAETARVPELRTIYYSFLSGAPGDEERGPSRRGLMRREMSFETAEGELETMLPEELTEFDDLETSANSAESSAPDPFDSAVVWVPEVAGLQFRYFDGTGWASSWDSIQQKSLPAAVEVTIQMGSPQEAPAAEMDLLAESTFEDISVVPTAGESYRVVVDLPGAPGYRKPKPAAAPTAARVAVRRIAAPRITTRPQQPARAADQWIRNTP